MLTLILERMFTTPKMISARPDVDKASGLFLFTVTMGITRLGELEKL